MPDALAGQDRLQFWDHRDHRDHQDHHYEGRTSRSDEVNYFHRLEAGSQIHFNLWIQSNILAFNHPKLSTCATIFCQDSPKYLLFITRLKISRYLSPNRNLQSKASRLSWDWDVGTHDPPTTSLAPEAPFRQRQRHLSESCGTVSTRVPAGRRERERSSKQCAETVAKTRSR